MFKKKKEEPAHKKTNAEKEIEKRVSARQTSGQAVIKMLKKHQAYDEASAIGYDVLKNVNLTTPVLAYTIANLMEEKVVVQTEDERYYFSQKNWDKLEKKVLSSYSILFIVPIVCFVIFYFLSKFIG